LSVGANQTSVACAQPGQDMHANTNNKGSLLDEVNVFKAVIRWRHRSCGHQQFECMMPRAFIGR
jgi:hypothetical protein